MMKILSDDTGKPPVHQTLAYRLHKRLSVGQTSTEAGERYSWPGIIDSGLIQ